MAIRVASEYFDPNCFDDEYYDPVKLFDSPSAETGFIEVELPRRVGDSRFGLQALRDLERRAMGGSCDYRRPKRC
jgi:hypothetical protein